MGGRRRRRSYDVVRQGSVHPADISERISTSEGHLETCYQVIEPCMKFGDLMRDSLIVIIQIIRRTWILEFVINCVDVDPDRVEDVE